MILQLQPHIKSAFYKITNKLSLTRATVVGRYKRPASKAGGFTLFEVLVAVTVLSIAFTPLFQLFGGSLRSIENSQKYSRAVTLGEEIMTEVLFYDENFEARSDSGRFEKNPDYSYDLNIALYEKPIGRVEENNEEETAIAQPATYRVRVIVRWREGASEKSLTLETLKTILVQPYIKPTS